MTDITDQVKTLNIDDDSKSEDTIQDKKPSIVMKTKDIYKIDNGKGDITYAFIIKNKTTDVNKKFSSLSEALMEKQRYYLDLANNQQKNQKFDWEEFKEYHKNALREKDVKYIDSLIQRRNKTRERK